ncbi:MAG: chemotaxis protein CheW [Desulfovibrio sp.]
MSEDKLNNVIDDDFMDDEDGDSQKDKYLTFHLGNEDYGLDIRYVIEIVGIQKITEVPDMPAFVKGVINLRGQVIPVMDVRTRFRMQPRDYDDRTCVIVVRINETSIGLVVDTVNEAADIPEKNVSPPPQVSKGSGSRFIKGMGKIGDDVKILLNVDKLLYEEELEKIGSAA